MTSTQRRAPVGAARAPAGASRTPVGTSRAPALIATAAALFGCVGLAAAMTGPWLGLAGGLQAAFVPEGTAQGAVRGLIVGASVGLLLLSRGLARRQHRSWTAAVVLSATATVLFLIRDVDVPAALVAGLLLASLWHWRAEFFAAASTRKVVITVATAATALLVVFVYGALAQIWQSAHAQLPLTWSAVASQAAWGMVGQDLTTPATDFSRELVAALTISTVIVLAALAWALLRPPKGRTTSTEREWREAKRLVEASGSDSLAYFALRRDKQYFFAEDHTIFLAFRAVAGIALVSGDPIGDEHAAPRLLEEFASYCRRQAWRPAAIGVGEEMRALWERVGLKTLYVGDEAVVHPGDFSLEGRAVRKLRQSVNRLGRLGYSVEILRAGELDAATLAAVVKVSEIWRGGQPERGFSMALDDVRSTELEDTLFVLGRGPDGQLAGFLHFVPVPATGGLSLSAMRRLPETPNGFNEFLVSSLLFWAGEHGVEEVSLNFAVFGGVLRDEGSGAARRVSRGALRYTDRFFQVERLLDFNRKFGPVWVPRYLAVDRSSDLPAVALVLLHLERLLPVGSGAAATPVDPQDPPRASVVAGGSGEPESHAE